MAEATPGTVQEPVRLALPEACAFLRSAVLAERKAKRELDTAIVTARAAGLSFGEIAELMEVTKTAVAQRLQVLERNGAVNA